MGQLNLRTIPAAGGCVHQHIPTNTIQFCTVQIVTHIELQDIASWINHVAHHFVNTTNISTAFKRKERERWIGKEREREQEGGREKDGENGQTERRGRKGGRKEQEKGAYIIINVLEKDNNSNNNKLIID